MERAIEQFRKRFGDFELVAGNVGDRRRGRRFWPSAAWTASRSGSALAAAAPRASPRTSACRSSRRWSSAGWRSAMGCRSSPTAASSVTAPDRGAALRRRHGDARQRLRRHDGDAGRDRAQAGRPPGSQKRAVKVPFKVLRGMASIGAIKDRLDVEDVDDVDLEAIGAEGMEISVPAARVVASGRAGDDQAPVLVDQLRGRKESGRGPSDVPERPESVPDQTVCGRAPRVVRTIASCDL